MGDRERGLTGVVDDRGGVMVLMMAVMMAGRYAY
jgi:hypothetical protein